MSDPSSGRVLIDAIAEARRGMKLLARVVQASSEVSGAEPDLGEVARGMQELAFQAWLLAVEARAEASRLAQLSERGSPAARYLGDAS
jgi:hypothetical protein